MPQLRSIIPANVDNVDKVMTALLNKNVREYSPIFSKLFKKQTTTRKFERTVTVAPYGDVPQKPVVRAAHVVLQVAFLALAAGYGVLAITGGAV